MQKPILALLAMLLAALASAHGAEVQVGRYTMQTEALGKLKRGGQRTVNAMRSEEESEMADVIEGLGHLKALVIGDLIESAKFLGSRYDAFVAFLQDRTKSRLVTASKSAAIGGWRTRTRTLAGG